MHLYCKPPRHCRRPAPPPAPAPRLVRSATAPLSLREPKLPPCVLPRREPHPRTRVICPSSLLQRERPSPPSPATDFARPRLPRCASCAAGYLPAHPDLVLPRLLAAFSDRSRWLWYACVSSLMADRESRPLLSSWRSHSDLSCCHLPSRSISCRTETEELCYKDAVDHRGPEHHPLQESLPRSLLVHCFPTQFL